MGNLQRENEILNILKEKEYTTVNELSTLLFTSPSSIRRDLTILENQGKVKRSHGGVSLLDPNMINLPFALRLKNNRQQKSALVKKAVALIPQNASVFLDSSTTALHFSTYLSADQNLTVFTNNLHLASALSAKQINTFCIGGYLAWPNHFVTVNSHALHMLENIYADFFFFTSASLGEDGIITDVNDAETAIRKAMLSHASQKVFLCPMERFRKRSPFQVASLSDINTVISDEVFPSFLQDAYPHTQFIC